MTTASGATPLEAASLQGAAQALDAVARALSDVRQALEQTRRQAHAVRVDTAWHAAAVRAYRRKADGWDAAIAAVIARVADEECAVRRLRDAAWAQGPGG